MRQVMLIAFAVFSLSALAGCTVVDPVYSYQMGGFPMRDGVSAVHDTTFNVKKVSKPVSFES